MGPRRPVLPADLMAVFPLPVLPPSLEICTQRSREMPNGHRGQRQKALRSTSGPGTSLGAPGHGGACGNGCFSNTGRQHLASPVLPAVA